MRQRRPGEAGADGSGAMFDRIAARYDLLNRLISMGADRAWRRRLVASLGSVDDGVVLDVATGTADVAIAVARTYPRCKVVGLDPSEGMLQVGRRKVAARGLGGRIELLRGDAQHLPLQDGRVAASCIAFGIRNVPDRGQSLREMARVTRRHGRVAVLELGRPDYGILAPIACLHVRHVVPQLGAWLSGDEEYRYLQRSVDAFPPAHQFAELMQRSGLRMERTEPLTWGAAKLFVATVP